MTDDDTPLATFTLEIVADANSGWPSVQVPGSAALLGTAKAIRIAARVNGHPYEATLLPIGGGVHMLPIRAPFRRQHGVDVGDRVELTLLR
ncbi:DUF1905 domain-containing protein [Brachybacterium sp. GCM10030267]|uniref:DUF1905 domain-containing protein n=1 Tax=Brachybacterium sp. GCM10030267 TaxID=3273381 RepID=UPI0036192778